MKKKIIFIKILNFAEMLKLLLSKMYIKIYEINQSRIPTGIF